MSEFHWQTLWWLVCLLRWSELEDHQVQGLLSAAFVPNAATLPPVRDPLQEAGPRIFKPCWR